MTVAKVNHVSCPTSKQSFDEFAIFHGQFRTQFTYPGMIREPPPLPFYT